ncbi:MAG: hypothetical protein ABI681_07005 [Gemmatimonadales bacterium]
MLRGELEYSNLVARNFRKRYEELRRNEFQASDASYAAEVRNRAQLLAFRNELQTIVVGALGAAANSLDRYAIDAGPAPFDKPPRTYGAQYAVCNFARR